MGKKPDELLRNDGLNGKGVAGIVCVEYSNNGANQKYVAISDQNVYEIRISGDKKQCCVPGKEKNNGVTTYNQTLFWPKNCFDKTVDVQSVNLLVDKKGTVYAITAGVKDKHSNMLQLYRMDVNERHSSGRILSAKMVYLKEKELILCDPCLTFSAATGIDVEGESIIIYVTSKPAFLSRRLTIGRSLA